MINAGRDLLISAPTVGSRFISQISPCFIFAIARSQNTELGYMANQTNTPLDWRLLAEDDLTLAEYLAANMRPIPRHHAEIK